MIDNLEESAIVYSMENFISSKSQTMMDMSESQNHLIKISSIVDSIEEFVESYLMKRSWFSKFNHFFFNDSFASCHRFRVEITNKYNYEELSCTTSDNCKIDM